MTRLPAASPTRAVTATRPPTILSVMSKRLRVEPKSSLLRVRLGFPASLPERRLSCRPLANRASICAVCQSAPSAQQMRGEIADLAPRPEDHAAEMRVNCNGGSEGVGLSPEAVAEILHPMREIEAGAPKIDMPAALATAGNQSREIVVADGRGAEYRRDPAARSPARASAQLALEPCRSYVDVPDAGDPLIVQLGDKSRRRRRAGRLFPPCLRDRQTGSLQVESRFGFGTRPIEHAVGKLTPTGPASLSGKKSKPIRRRCSSFNVRAAR